MRARIGPFGLGMVTSWMVIFLPATGFRMAGKDAPFHCIRRAMDCKYVRATGHNAADSATMATSSPRPNGKRPRFVRCGVAVWTGETNVLSLS